MTTPPPVSSPELDVLYDDDPRELGPYRVVGRLGTGGMGTVYAALGPDDACVAVKVIKPEFADSATYRESFAREVEVLRGLTVMCAPRFLGAYVGAGQPWLATEFVPGRTLSRHVRELGPLEGDALLAFAAGTAEALHTLHTASVLHRDIKPGNVILSPDGPRVLDFGIARRAEEHDAQEGVYGTPGYLAPERLAGAADTAAADVFAWGGLVAFAATSRSPFGTGDSSAVLERTRAGEQSLDGVPEELLPLIERALSREPADRPLALECFQECLALGSGVPSNPIEDLPRAKNRLGALLGTVWRGFDDAGHDPRAWGALVGGVGVAGGVAAAAAATSASSASMVGGTATAGSAAGLFTTKTVALAAGGTLAVAAVGAGGYFAVEAQAASQRQETVEQAAAALADGAGFTAELTRQFEGDRAEEYAVQSGSSTEELLQATTSGFELRYTAESLPVFTVELTTMDGEEVEGPDQRREIVANVDGEIHAYSNAMRDPESWFATIDRFTEDAYSVDTIVQPLRALAGADDLTEEGTESIDGVETTRYSGSFLSRRVLGETTGETDATGDVWLDDAGAPVRLVYSTSGWEISVEFVEVDAAAEVEEPDVGYNVQSATHTQLVYTPGCGEVSSIDGAVFTVHADAWDVNCAQAMAVAEDFAGGGGEAMMGWVGTGVQRFLFEDDGVSCEQITPMVEAGVRDVVVPQFCNPTTVDPDASDPLDRYDVDMDTWSIVFIPEDSTLMGPTADPRHSLRTE